tara:strand:- start:134 stop:1921 length:1788 start_codon:yes stop_codon:yes gene_type:complete
MQKKSSLPEIIVELANSHDGNKEKILECVEVVGNLDYLNKSIKFQIFSPETIALKDFEWFEVYKEITFDADFWKETLELSYKKIGNVWIDIFDSYGVEIFGKNQSFVSGLKLQSSVLENSEVKGLLSSLDLTQKRLIINISGFEISKINELLIEFSNLNPKEIILQLGFQSYPTKISDTGLQKISTLKNRFKNKICLADHVDGTLEGSIDIPIYGIARGADMIEKHLCLDRKNTKYDYFSSLEPQQFNLLIDKIKNYIDASSGPFISDSELTYLDKSIQIPVLRKKILAHNIISLKDLKFRRTAQTGLTYPELSDIQKGFKILSKDIEKDSSITQDDFRDARIGVIIAGRLKSSRLKRKALLPILGKPSIQWCFDSCLQISSAQDCILATSTLSEDSELEETIKYNKKVNLFRGDPLDVISRYLGACYEYKIDVIVRVTADCPFISEEIAEILLKEHFKNGADYTAARDFSVGTSVEIINTSALETVIKHVGKADLSEYMTWYFQNNSEIFKVHIVDLPPHLVRDYRLTLDYQEDLDMFESLLSSMGDLPVTTSNIFKTLDENPKINEINSHLTLTYKVDKKLIAKLDRDTKIKI